MINVIKAITKRVKPTIFFHRMPFNYKANIMSYSIVYIIESMSGYTSCFIIAATNTFFFGMCWYINACLEDLLDLFEKMDDLVAPHEGFSLEKGLNERLSEAILFHSRITRLVISREILLKILMKN